MLHAQFESIVKSNRLHRAVVRNNTKNEQTKAIQELYHEDLALL